MSLLGSWSDLRRVGGRDVAILAVFFGACLSVRGLEEQGWDRTVSVGGQLTSGNSEALTVNVSIAGLLDMDKHEWRLGAESNYGESEVAESEDGGASGGTEASTENARAYLGYKRKFGRIYAYWDNSVLHDEVADVDLRLIAGVGGGVYVVEAASVKASVETGVAYVREELGGGVSDDYFALRFGVRHDQTLSETAKIWESVEYLPRAEDWNDCLLNGEIGLEAALNSGSSLRIVIQDRYDAEPATGAETNDLAVVGSLVFKI